MNEAAEGEIGFKALQTFMEEKTKPTLHDLCINELYAVAEGMRQIIIQQGRDIETLKKENEYKDTLIKSLDSIVTNFMKKVKALEERKLDRMIPSDLSSRCHNLNGLECPGANASDCIARISHLPCPTYCDEERRKIIEKGEKQK